MRKSAAMTFADFIYEVNHKLMGDFVSMSNDEINRFLKMEKLLESKISRRFQFRRLDKNDFGYLLEHIYGNTGVAYSDYSYDLPIKKLKRETLVKRYDLIRPTRCMIEENQRYLKIEREDQTTLLPTSRLTISWVSWIFRQARYFIISNSNSRSPFPLL